MRKKKTLSYELELLLLNVLFIDHIGSPKVDSHMIYFKSYLTYKIDSRNIHTIISYSNKSICNTF